MERSGHKSYPLHPTSPPTVTIATRSAVLRTFSNSRLMRRPLFVTHKGKVLTHA